MCSMRNLCQKLSHGSHITGKSVCPYGYLHQMPAMHRYCPHEAKYFDDPAFLSHVRMLETQYTAKKANVMYW